MAVSSGFAKTLSGAKMETFLSLNSSYYCTSSVSFVLPQDMRVSCKPSRNNFRRRVSLNHKGGGVRCEVSTASNDVALAAEIDPARVSSLSALEQLKTSAVDSELFSLTRFFVFIFRFCCFY